MLSDAEIIKRISVKLKELRLKQNISRQDVSASSGVSMSSIARIEDGEIKWVICKVPWEPYPKIEHSLNMKKGRSLTPLS